MPFEPGTLKAVGTNGGRAVATHELKTAGQPARIVLAADRMQLAPVWDDVVYVTATVVDANGVLVPTASDLITFKLTGPGRIAAVDSGDNASHEPFQATERRAYQGRCFALLKATASTGPLTLVAAAPGLANGTVMINTVAPAAFKLLNNR